MKKDTEYKNLVALIKQRAKIIKDLRSAKGDRREKLEEDLRVTKRYIKMLDQKQQ